MFGSGTPNIPKLRDFMLAHFNYMLVCLGFDSISEIAWICECDVTSVARLWIAANFEWRLFLKITWAECYRGDHIPFWRSVLGDLALKSLCSRASRVCIVWMAEGDSGSCGYWWGVWSLTPFMRLHKIICIQGESLILQGRWEYSLDCVLTC